MRYTGNGPHGLTAEQELRLLDQGIDDGSGAWVLQWKRPRLVNTYDRSPAWRPDDDALWSHDGQP